MKSTKILLGLLPALLAVLLLTGANCSGSGNDSDGGQTNYCDIPDDGLAPVAYHDDVFTCSGDLGVSLSVSQVRANAGLTIVEVRGQYAIDNNNTYYLRGAGIGGDACWEELHGSGSFTVRMQSEDCHAKRRVILSTDRADAVVVFCSLTFAIDQTCPDGDDDDTWLDDDTWSDDDTWPDDDAIDDDVTPDDDAGDDDVTPDDDAIDDDVTPDDDAIDDDATDDDAADDDTVGALFHVNFEDYELGELGSPWTYMFQSGSSVANVIALKDGAGQVLEIVGGTLENTDYLGVNYAFGDLTAGLSISWDMIYLSGTPRTSSGFRLFQNYEDTPFTEVQLHRDPASGDLMMYDPDIGDYAICQTLADDTWYHITLFADWNSATASVAIDGEASPACTNVMWLWGDGYPLSEIGFLDWSDEGDGGTFRVDNIIGRLL